MKLKDVQLLKMNENIDDVTIYKYYDMVQNKSIIMNAKFELICIIDLLELYISLFVVFL